MLKSKHAKMICLVLMLLLCLLDIRYRSSAGFPGSFQPVSASTSAMDLPAFVYGYKTDFKEPFVAEGEGINVQLTGIGHSVSQEWNGVKMDGKFVLILTADGFGRKGELSSLTYKDEKGKQVKGDFQISSPSCGHSRRFEEGFKLPTNGASTLTEVWGTVDNAYMVSYEVGPLTFAQMHTPLGPEDGKAASVLADWKLSHKQSLITEYAIPTFAESSSPNGPGCLVVRLYHACSDPYELLPNLRVSASDRDRYDLVPVASWSSLGIKVVRTTGLFSEVKVVKVASGSLACSKGIRTGDIITMVDYWVEHNAEADRGGLPVWMISHPEITLDIQRNKIRRSCTIDLSRIKWWTDNPSENGGIWESLRSHIGKDSKAYFGTLTYVNRTFISSGFKPDKAVLSGYQKKGGTKVQNFHWKNIPIPSGIWSVK